MELAHIKISDPDFAAYLRAAGARVVPLRCPTADVALEQLDGQQIIDAVSQVLADPLEFPPLAQATLPCDHVAIALGDGIPQVGRVSSCAVEACRGA